MGNSKKASQLCSKELRFGDILKVVEKYWEFGPLSICISCMGIRYDWLGGCSNRKVQYVICANTHKVENHKCGMIGYTAKIGKICTYVTSKYVNC